LKLNSYKKSRFYFKLINFLISEIIYFKFENKKNQIKVMAFREKIIPKNIYANFLPMNAVSGSSFTLIKLCDYLIKITSINN